MCSYTLRNGAEEGKKRRGPSPRPRGFCDNAVWELRASDERRADAAAALTSRQRRGRPAGRHAASDLLSIFQSGMRNTERRRRRCQTADQGLTPGKRSGRTLINSFRGFSL
ncbi:hypothetical protein EYF80_013340 [Liparis tanakae]|uniref:Uncharacterized protein n=1 Tax=Liparis tanakae TaxID=230148 RepID=A0A4Z2IFS1_9TELE|nr:hypothetical protein EYF80_013340 [Liparis tanakae]